MWVLLSIYELLDKLAGEGVAEVSIIDVSGDKVRVRCKIIGRRLTARDVERVVRKIEECGGKIVLIGNRFEFFLVFDIKRGDIE